MTTQSSLIRRRILPVIILCLHYALLSAQGVGVGVNLSLWPGIATQKVDSTRPTCLNIGLYSSMSELRGVGVNILGARVSGKVSGLQLGGLFAYDKGDVNGLQLSGLVNINGASLNGISLSGLTNVTSGQANGLSLSGLLNVVGAENAGLSVAGLMNFVGDGSRGLQVAGLVNLSSGSFAGVSVSPLLNVTGRSMSGWQLSPVGNIAAERMTGWQLSVLGNVAGEQLRGAQVGAVNSAKEVHGLQVGLVNISREVRRGVQLGMVNITPHTRWQVLAFGGSNSVFNVGVRVKNHALYTLIGMGSHYLGADHKPSLNFFYRAGLMFPIVGNLSLGADLGYQHIETLHNKHNGLPARMYGLQGLVNLEYRLTRNFGLFVSGGYGATRYYDKAKTYDRGVIVEGGVVVLRY